MVETQWIFRAIHHVLNGFMMNQWISWWTRTMIEPWNMEENSGWNWWNQQKMGIDMLIDSWFIWLMQAPCGFGQSYQQGSCFFTNSEWEIYLQVMEVINKPTCNWGAPRCNNLVSSLVGLGSTVWESFLSGLQHSNRSSGYQIGDRFWIWKLNLGMNFGLL